MEDNFDLNDWEALSEGSRRAGSDLPLLFWIFIPSAIGSGMATP